MEKIFYIPEIASLNSDQWLNYSEVGGGWSKLQCYTKTRVTMT